ncbi:MAG: rhomboid family intramembrane serine protease [Pseudomonadota bacterium]
MVNRNFPRSFFVTHAVSLTVVFICIGLFVVQWVGIPIYSLLMFPKEFAHPFDWIKAFTPVFLHFSLLHIAFNLAIWWFFARQIEVRLGKLFLIVFLLAAGYFSNLAQFIWSGPRFGGLSGVVFGVAAFCWAFNVQRQSDFFIVPVGLIIQLMLLIVLGFLGWLDFLLGELAHAAHAGGFLVGILFGMFMARKK